MSHKKLSVIIPVYNCEGTIKKCVESILSSLYDSLEIILVNDGSTDNSFAICKELAEHYNIIKVICTNNKGVSHARNIGLQAATAEYIMFVDGDDYLAQDAIPACIDVLKRKKIDLLCFGCISDYQTADGELLKQEKRKSNFLGTDREGYIDLDIRDSFSQLFENNLFDSACGKVYRRSVVADHKLSFDEAMTMREDSEFVLQYVQFASGIGVLDKYYYHYCIRGSELSYYLRREVRCSDIAKLMNRYRVLMQLYGIDDLQSKVRVYKHIFIHIIAGIIYIAYKGNKKTLHALILFLKEADSILDGMYPYLKYRGFYALIVYLMKCKAYRVCALVCKIRFSNSM